MREVFLEVKTRRTAVRRAPWACKVLKVDGGYMAWESWANYELWLRTK
ncbi:hypothetical protein LCGC14_0634420 [marine sediment metagenome]|uniref:Uncharacterized protein n=1 Tax=marine sediment metagenome TaxID=412755 RepID=A0A0F9R123_9ZZZZ